jgi:flagellar motor switch protein FliN/FliY
MNEFTQDELTGIVHAMSQKKLTEEEKSKIPLRPPATYKKKSKIGLSPLFGEIPRPLEDLSDTDTSALEMLKVQVEVIFGKAHLTLKELASLEEGSLLPLEDLCDDLVDIYANGVKVGRGEIVAVDGHFGVKIVTFTKK